MEIARIYQLIFEAVQDRSVEQLTKTASDLLNMPIVVTDTTFVVLAKYPTAKFDDEQWDANEINHQIRPKYIKVFQKDDLWSAYGTEGRRAIYVNWGFFATSPRYSAQIVNQGKIVGYVAALLRDAQVEDWHLEAMQVIADGLSVVMEIQNRSKYSADIMSGVMLQGLLLGEFADEAEIERLCEITGDSIKPNYMLAAIKTKKPQHTPLEKYLGDELAHYFQNTPRVIRDDYLYVLFTDIDEIFKYKREFKEAVHKLKEAEAVCAFSRVFTKLLTVSDYKWQVDKLLEVGATLRPDKTIFHFEDYELSVFIAMASGEVCSESMIHPLLRQLSEYDDAHNTEYLETLKTYIYNYFDNGTTVKKMHIHRNTLLYRLAKIEEIAGTGLMDRDFGFILYLSFRYLDMNHICLSEKMKLHKKKIFGNPGSKIMDNRDV